MGRTEPRLRRTSPCCYRGPRRIEIPTASSPGCGESRSTWDTCASIPDRDGSHPQTARDSSAVATAPWWPAQPRPPPVEGSAHRVDRRRMLALETPSSPVAASGFVTRGACSRPAARSRRRGCSPTLAFWRGCRWRRHWRTAKTSRQRLGSAPPESRRRSLS